eukprot:CAMPEP_0198736830 /NCGR_PEP_ID=MMETSP1475-20131203/67559_1 /TAXON_ID= ORGANISM="Unidentified sp., Strain CCMP1999" /NCGR_SAMPLE_ID=MMETSP1475 /ASSEMBLY_ACC=CAM_ASM_001111 /LENGTH=137 /DNA_ID=CAMNT_0044500681 /DNA_START=650 /DNA_END=1063 /DNA_ORIENTATION=-
MLGPLVVSFSALAVLFRFSSVFSRSFRELGNIGGEIRGLQGRIGALETRLGEKMGALDMRLSKEMGALDVRLSKEIGAVNVRLERMEIATGKQFDNFSNKVRDMFAMQQTSQDKAINDINLRLGQVEAKQRQGQSNK